MSRQILYLPEALKDLKNLPENQKRMTLKAIGKVQTNPLPASEGGYGKPLGNKGGRNLSGFLKIKLKDAGIRVVYKLIRTETQMLIVVIGARADEEVYDAAERRIQQNNL